MGFAIGPKQSQWGREGIQSRDSHPSPPHYRDGWAGVGWGRVGVVWGRLYKVRGRCGRTCLVEYSLVR